MVKARKLIRFVYYFIKKLKPIRFVNYFIKKLSRKLTFWHSFKTRTDPTGRPGTRPTRAWNRSGWRPKPGWELARPDPVKTRPQTRWLFFLFFFTKTTSFWFKKKMTRRPGQNPEPWPWTGPTTGPGLKLW